MTIRCALRLVLPVAAAAAILSGCSERPTAEVYEVEPAETAAAPIFCYRTLARPDCYGEPQPGPPNRLIGRSPILVLP